jgi:thioester reductase-like protein
MTPAASAPSSGRLSSTESLFLTAASSTLRRQLYWEDVDAPLSVLGLDSLGIIEMTAAVEDVAGVAVPSELAHESITIRELASWMDDLKEDQSDAGTDPHEQMIADSVLPEDVRPGSGRSEVGLLNANAILITGATGFLGARLAADLLARSHARLYCVVRPGTEMPAERLRRQLLRNGGDPTDILHRVETIEADLARPRLGLDSHSWEEIGERVDRILHAGASVNWISSYSALRHTNVLGTLELLRLACRPVPIPFHFVSSLSVCYAVDGPSVVDEAFDPLPHARNVHLGYAQTKIVAEALIRRAGWRGLPVKIYRPSLISADSRTGAFNPDDLLSLLIRGCVRMGSAPDLDWALDCEPVDVVSAGILELSSQRHTTTHLTHLRPRHWRECLLWMRLMGYEIRLVPYQQWLEQLVAETTASGDHPLRPLRPFFLNRPANGLTLPELYEEPRRTRASSTRTALQLQGAIDRPTLDAVLLDRYFSAYRTAGYLPPPAGSCDSETTTAVLAFDTAFFESAMASRGRNVRVLSATRTDTGSEHSIISELTAWRSRQPAGLFCYSLETETDRSIQIEQVVVKLKPHADDVIAVGESLARLCDARVGDAFAQWGHRMGLAASHLRERAIYECKDERLTRFMPSLIGVMDLDTRGSCALVLEDVSDATLMDSVNRTPWWGPAAIEIVIRDLASIHAVSYGATSPLRDRPWLGFVQTTDSLSEMSNLWRALADHAARAFADWGGPDLPGLHRKLIDSIEEWQPVVDASPQALIHNDFNPRNICLSDRAGGLTLCVYDWELATLGAPQRDLAELLCFVLPPRAADATIECWIERHRAALVEATGSSIDRHLWWRGFDAAMNDLLVNRLAMYALINRVRPQGFLPRVIATWRRIHELVETVVR